MNQIPNILTLCNLFCGCCAIVCVLNNHYNEAFYLFCGGFFFDAADGPVARKMGVSSEMGKELDSLADMVTFGVLPGIIMYTLLIKSFAFGGDAANIRHGAADALNYKALPAFLISVFACYRLAKFNLDTRQSDVFLGLATPASTTFVVGLMLIYRNNTTLGDMEIDPSGNIKSLGDMVMNPYLLYGTIIALCVLQISELPLMKFRMENYGIKGNEMRYAFLALLIIGLILFKEAVFAFGVLAYIACSVGHNFVFDKKS